MKKTILYLILSLLAVAILFGITTIVFLKNPSKVSKFDLPISNDYEVVEFVEPDKTLYYLSDVSTIYDVIDEYGGTHFQQSIDFDGTGMSIVLRNKKTGELETYEYTGGYYFELDGHQVKCENSNFGLMYSSALNFDFNPDYDTILTPGTYITDILVVTNSGEIFMHEMDFSLMADPTSNLTSQDKPDTLTHIENETTAAGLPVIPNLKRSWYHANDPSNCIVTVTNQDDDTFDLHIVCIKENSAEIATTDVSFTLDNVHKDSSTVRGESTFEYTDSYQNKGTGKISISAETIILVLQEEQITDASWGVSSASGCYY